MTHAHDRDHPHGHGHTHALDQEVLRSREFVRAVLLSLGVLAATAGVQAVVFVLSGSVGARRWDSWRVVRRGR